MVAGVAKIGPRDANQPQAVQYSRKPGVVVGGLVWWTVRTVPPGSVAELVFGRVGASGLLTVAAWGGLRPQARSTGRRRKAGDFVLGQKPLPGYPGEWQGREEQKRPVLLSLARID